MKPTIVLFPESDGPTIAVTLPASKVVVRFCKI